MTQLGSSIVRSDQTVFGLVHCAPDFASYNHGCEVALAARCCPVPSWKMCLEHAQLYSVPRTADCLFLDDIHRVMDVLPCALDDWLYAICHLQPRHGAHANEATE